MATITNAKKRIDLLKKCSTRASITPVYLGEVLDEIANATETEVRTTRDVIAEVDRKRKMAYTDIDCELTQDSVVFTPTVDGKAQQSFFVPTATKELAGLMSASDRWEFESIKEQTTNAIKDISIEEGNGTYQLLVDRGDSDFLLVFPTATTSISGLMSAADKVKLDKLKTEKQLTDAQYRWVSEKSATSIETYTATYEAKMPLIKNKQYALASLEKKAGVVAWSTHFRLSVIHSQFCGTLEFAVYVANGKYIIDTGASTGNLPFVGKIRLIETGGNKLLVFVPSENLTAENNLPSIRLDMVGSGWIGTSPHYYELTVGSVLAEVTPIYAKFADIAVPATTSSNGLMTAYDKRKLDAVSKTTEELMRFVNELANRITALEQNPFGKGD